MRSVWWLGLDVASVVAFVLLGREAHAEGNAFVGVVTTAAPFLMALLVGWVGARAWLRPLSLQMGVIVYLVTVGGGMALRRLAFGEGTALSFVVVAALFLGLTMLGWRVIVGSIARRREVRV